MAKARRPATPLKSTKKSAKSGNSSRAVKAAADSSSVMGLPLKTWISGARRAKGPEIRSGSRGFLLTLHARDIKKNRASLSPHLNKWQLGLFAESDAESLYFQGLQGPVWILRPPVTLRASQNPSDVQLQKSPYARVRDLAGPVVAQAVALKIEKLILETDNSSTEERRGLLVGLEMASYSYAENRGNPRKSKRVLPQILLRASGEEYSEQELATCSNLALGVNIARHLVNVPGGELNPRSYAEAVQSMFSGSRTVKVDVLAGERLSEERMGLLRAVGGGAEEAPRLVHIRYRPKANTTQKPLALVGKGITFDSGGLDIKPSSGMRWMKKDMGGSAACVGIAKWAELSNLDVPLDIYIALAENAIGSKSFRPGDIITARNGLTIEIHNTDAEGRLVLADALDYAVTREGADKPSAVINLATLTGAIKVALGAEIAGLFSNSDKLADAIVDAGVYRGELSWRMPLFQQYKTLFRSTFADYANASDGFGGAITAALFLELFVGQTPWAHLDIYAWKDSISGPFGEAGGNGQSVQMLTELLTRLSQGADQNINWSSAGSTS